jgi:hypothetical protein
MPRVDELFQDVTAMIQKHADRRKRKFQHQELLPEDFCGQIFVKARDEAAKIRERMDWLEGQLQRVNAELKEARAEVIRACAHCWIPGRRTGNILFDFEVTDPQPDPNRLQLSPSALKMRQQKAYPLMKHKQAIERELSNRQLELSELKKIAERAGCGDVSLIFFLTDEWRSKLEISTSLFGKLPPAARLMGTRMVVDPFGNVLPQEAIGDDGKPDLPGTIPWHGQHEETTLPGIPQTETGWEKR